MHESHKRLSLLACKIAGQACVDNECYPYQVFSGSTKTSAVKARDTIIEIIDEVAGWVFSHLNISADQHPVLFVGDDQFDKCTTLPNTIIAKLFDVDQSAITYARERIRNRKINSRTT